MKHLALLILFQVLLTPAWADYKILPPLKADASLSSWIEDYLQRLASGSRDVECRRLSALKSTYICQFPELETADITMERAALFVEGNFGHPPRTVPLQKSPSTSQYAASGHNRSSFDLQAFFSQAQQLCQTQINYCLNPLEEKFFNQFFFPIERQHSGPFYVITLFPNPYWRVVYAHEYFHALYFEDKAFQLAINTFWNHHLTAAERQLIRLELTDRLNGYYGDVDPVLIDEFQAYALSEDVRDKFKPASQALVVRLKKFLVKMRLMPQLNLYR